MSVVPPTGCGEKDLRYILFEEQVLRAVPLLSLRSFILVKTIPTDYRVHSPIMDFKLTNGQVEEEEPQVNELDVNRWGRLQPKVGVVWVYQDHARIIAIIKGMRERWEAGLCYILLMP